MSAPWGKFFWSDWESDPALKLCSLAAQGLWMRMLCIAAAHEPMGYVAVAGRALDAPQIARMAGGSLDEVSALLEELEINRVFSRDRTGKIFSRRMIKDAKKAKTAREMGKKGGNPNLSKQTRNPASDNPPVNPTDNGGDNTQKPEARSHMPEPSYGRPVSIASDVSAVMHAAGMAAMPNDGSLVREWLDLPDMQLERDILPVVRRVAESEMRRTGRAPFKFKLFDAAVRQQASDDAAEIARLRAGRERIERTEREQRAAQE